MTQMKTLGMLDDCVEEVSVKELSERLGLSLPATSRTVDGLLRRGLLSRREDTEDRRIKRVRLTDDGRDVVDRIDDRAARRASRPTPQPSPTTSAPRSWPRSPTSRTRRTAA